MMEDGYYPVYRKTYITFSIGDDTAVLEYNQGILTLKIFFSIDDEYAALLLTAANTIMQSSPTIKSLMDEEGNDDKLKLQNKTIVNEVDCVFH